MAGERRPTERETRRSSSSHVGGRRTVSRSLGRREGAITAYRSAFIIIDALYFIRFDDRRESNAERNVVYPLNAPDF